MKHVIFLALVLTYVVVIGQNWGIYSAALLLALYHQNHGELNSIPFTIG